MKYTKEELTNYFEWDVQNWSKAIDLWDMHIHTDNKNLSHKKALSCLGIGERNGGLSLYLANKGFHVICSDLENPKSIAIKLHHQFPNIAKNITYQAVNATDIPFNNTFDIVVFKSVMGGVGSNNNFNAQKTMIEQIYKSLKKGGKLLFAENLNGGKLHQTLRKKFVKWGSRWRYIKINEMEELFNCFESVEYKTCGYLGLLGRNNWQRNILGKIDSMIFDKICTSESHYVIYGVATK